MRLNRCLLGTAALLLATTAGTAEAATYFDAPSNLPGGGDWTNYLRLADLDLDGDLDLIVPNAGGFFTNPSAQPLHVMTNDGSGNFTLATMQALGSTQNLAVRVVAVGDVTGDGAPEIFAPSAGGAADRFWINNGSGTFTDEASTRLPGGGTASRSAGARFADIDNDGDLDLLVALGYAAPDTPVAALYLNDGTGTFTDGSANIPMSGPGTDPDDVDFLDVDRDFDLDVLITTHAGDSILWINEGGVFTDASAQVPGPVSGPFKYGPSACDVDGDGDLDIWVDNVGGGNRLEQLLINDGNGNFTDETSARVTGQDDLDDNGVQCVDIDDDGDFDAVIPSLNFGPGVERILINDGAGNFAPQANNDTGFPNVLDPTLWMDFGDLNGDGRLDVVTGQGEGNPETNLVYLGSNEQPVDSTAPTIIAVETVDVPEANADLVIRYAVSDRSVSDQGPRLASAVATVTVDGAAIGDIPAFFQGGDLYRVVIPGQAEGAEVAIELCATDPVGNNACSSTLTYTVGDPSSGVGGGGAGGGGVGGSGGSAGSGGSGGTSSGSGGSDGGEDDGGCGCTTPGGDRDSSALALLVAGLGLGVARRRRRR